MGKYGETEQECHWIAYLVWYDEFRKIFDAFVEWYDADRHQQPDLECVGGCIEVEILVRSDAGLVRRFEHRVPAAARAEALVDEARVRLPEIIENEDVCDGQKRWEKKSDYSGEEWWDLVPENCADDKSVAKSIKSGILLYSRFVSTWNFIVIDRRQTKSFEKAFGRRVVGNQAFAIFLVILIVRVGADWVFTEQCAEFKFAGELEACKKEKNWSFFVMGKLFFLLWNQK